MRSRYGLLELARCRPCEDCGVGVDELCLTSTGKRRSEPHRSRRAGLWEAFREGRKVGEEDAVMVIYNEGHASWREKYLESWLAEVWERLVARRPW